MNNPSFNPQDPDLDSLFYHLEQSPDPNTKRLREKGRKFALKGGNLPPDEITPLGVIQSIRSKLSILICQERDILNNTIPTAPLKAKAHTTATINTISNITDFLLNQSFWAAVLKSSSPFSLALALAINTFILITANKAVSWSSSYRKDCRIWASGGFLKLVAINGICTAITFVGSTITTGGSLLPEFKANQIFHEQTTTKVEEATRTIMGDLYDNIPHFQSQCKEGDEMVQQLKRAGDPNFHRKYRELYGSYAERYTEWTALEDFSLVPICHKEAWIVARFDRIRTDTLAPVKGAVEKKASYATTLEFLKKELPDTYQLYFTPAGEVKNGIDLVATAAQFLRERVSEGDFAPIFIALILNGVSAITSFAAVYSMYFLVTSDEFQEAADEKKLQMARKYLSAIKSKASQQLS